MTEDRRQNKRGKNGETDFLNPDYYVNRELSWLLFNERVLEEARNRNNPLFERLKFLSITASNLDEFFMVRVASLKDMIAAGVKKADLAGMTPKQQMKALNTQIHQFVDLQYSTFNRSLLPQIEKQNLHLVDSFEELSETEIRFLDRYFDEHVYPVLTPMAVDSSRPFPLIRNKSLNIGALVRRSKEASSRLHRREDAGEVEFVTVQVPAVLPRIVDIPGQGETRRIMLLERLIQHNMQKLFLNYEIVCDYPFRIGRNAGFSLEEEDVADLLQEIEKQVKQRKWGEVIRLEVEKGIDKRLLKFLVDKLNVDKEDVFQIDGPLDLTFLMQVYKLEGYDDLKEHAYPKPQPVPAFPEGCDIFEKIREGDVLMHHPYETFDPVVRFVSDAAEDPKVLAIKQTLYRVSGNSPIIKALAKAAENGKQVTVLVELKARFDEEHNIVWARMLEQAGCHVIYGLVGLKTHCKITLVVRNEDEGIRRYVHLGTGNYNDSTAKQYTDLGMMTCKEPYGEDATAVFNMLSGYSEPRFWNKLSLAPLWLKDRILYLIRRETEHARNGEPGRIIAKMNSLNHREVIAALYEASAAGVQIDLIIRGICCLKVGIPGVSENIRVRSIVGNFLEHSRVFYFGNAGEPEYYCASADWMPRNLERRVEIMFPVEEEKLQAKIMHVLNLELKDTQQASVLQADGTYKKIDKRGKTLVNSQLQLGLEAREKARISSQDHTRVFIPETKE